MQRLREARRHWLAVRIERLIEQDTLLVSFWLLNAFLSIAVRQFQPLATLHAWTSLSIAVAVTLLGRRSEHIAYALAYICGSEVLWRMSNSGTPYEIVKYLVALCSFVAVGRMQRKNVPLPALLYLLLLIPGAVMTAVLVDWGPRLSKMLSFNMSGPIALSAAACFFSNVSFTRIQVWRLMLIFAAPILGIAAVTMFFTYTATPEQLQFNTESNEITSAGFGPNQVSSILGLGSIILLLYLAQEDLRPRRKLIVALPLIACLMQSALTFSRSGLYSVGVTMACALFFLMRNARIRARITFLISGGAILAIFVIVPFLISFTGGAIAKRFSDTQMTGREGMVKSDLNVWKNNFFYGVGAGRAWQFRPTKLVAHNELTRVLAEHGLLGFVALCCLSLLGVQRLLRARGPVERAFVAAMYAWGLLFMVVNGFRIAAPAFAIAIACMNLQFAFPSDASRSQGSHGSGSPV